MHNLLGIPLDERLCRNDSRRVYIALGRKVVWRGFQISEAVGTVLCK